MSRETTFGYDATISISGSVVEQVVEGLFLQGRIPEAFNINAGGALLRNVRARPVESDSGDLEIEVTIEIAQLAGVGAGDLTPTIVFIAPVQSLTASTILLDFSGLTAASLQFDPLTDSWLNALPNGDAMRAAVAAALTMINPNALSFNVDMTDRSLGVDRNDISADGNDLVIGLYGSGDGTPTGAIGRGDANDLESLLTDENSFAYRLSSSAFERLVQNFIDTFWGNAELTVPDTGRVGTRGILLEPPNENGVVILSSSRGAHGGVILEVHVDRDNSIHRVTTDEDGVFTLDIPGAQVGDTLTLNGIRKAFGNNLYAAQPEITLADGAIRLRVSATRDGALNYEVDVDMDLVPEPDLSSATRIKVRGRNFDLDLPWYVNIAKTLPFAFLAFIFIEDRTRRTITDVFSAALPDPGRGLQGGGFAVFIDAVTVAEGHLELAGQIHGGSILRSGRVMDSRAPGFVQFDDDGTRRQAGALNLTDAPMADFAVLRESQLTTTPIGLPVLPAPSEPHSDGSVTILSGTSLIAKAELQRAEVPPLGQRVIRWVSYRRPDLTPRVSLSGLVGPANELGGLRQFDDQAHPVWQANIRATPSNALFDSPSTMYHWEVDGPGVVQLSPSQNIVIWELRDTDMGVLPQGGRPTGINPRIPGFEDALSSYGTSFRTVFRVHATDIFGRTATLAYTLSGVLGQPNLRGTGEDDIRDRFVESDFGPGSLRRDHPSWQASSTLRELEHELDLRDALRRLSGPKR